MKKMFKNFFICCFLLTVPALSILQQEIPLDDSVKEEPMIADMFEDIGQMIKSTINTMEEESNLMNPEARFRRRKSVSSDKKLKGFGSGFAVSFEEPLLGEDEDFPARIFSNPFSDMKNHFKRMKNMMSDTKDSNFTSNETLGSFTSQEVYETFENNGNSTKRVILGKKVKKEAGKPEVTEIFHESDDGKGKKLSPEEEAGQLKKHEGFLRPIIKGLKLSNTATLKNQETASKSNRKSDLEY